MDGNQPSQDDHVSDQRNLKYSSVLSLESIAAVKVVGELWKHHDLMLDLTLHTTKFGHHSGNCSDGESGASFEQMEKKVLENLSHLLLPPQSKEIALNFIRPVGLEILNWVDPYLRDCHDVPYLGYQSPIFLTINGTIDKIKALDWRLNYVFSDGIYESACIYCSEAHITEIWRCFSTNTKNVFRNGDYKKYSSHFIAYWTFTLSGETEKLSRLIKSNDYHRIYVGNHSICKNMFALSISEGNVLAVKYFWRKLTQDEISRHIVKWTQFAVRRIYYGTKFANYQESNPYTDITCFLLSQLDHEEQNKIFSKYSVVILESLFSDWPWQKYLLPTMRVMWDYLEDRAYLNLLSKISSEIKEGRSTEKLLRNLLSESPLYLQKWFVQDYTLCASVIRKLLQSQDAITIHQILSYASVEQKRTLGYCVIKPREQIYQLAYTGKLYLLSMSLGNETTLSMDNVGWYFKYIIIRELGNQLCHDWICNDDWQSVDRFSAWAFSSPSQIAVFKRKTLDRVQVTADLVRQGDFGLVNKFINWCFNSQQGISQFKKKLLYGELQLNGYYLGILELLCDECEWGVYEKVIKWCCKSDKDICEFKKHVAQFDRMESMVHRVIGSKYRFEFAEKLLCWCFDSYEDVKRFKAEFSVSKLGGINLIANLIRDPEVEGECTNWELVKELLKWLHPLRESVVTEMKRVFLEKAGAFLGCQASAPLKSRECKKQALFHLLDGFALDQDECYSSNADDDDATSVFGAIIEDDSDDSDCSINTDVMDILYDVMDISSDENGDDNFEFEAQSKVDNNLSMDVN